MYFWIPFAFVRIVVFFSTGILIGIFMPFSLPLLPVVMLFIFLSVGYALIAFVQPIRARINPGFLGLVAILVAGFINTRLQTESASPFHLLKRAEKPAYYRAVISAYVQEKEKSWKTEATVSAVNVQGKWEACEGKVLIYFAKQLPAPSYGDLLLVKGAPEEVQGPMNPGTFNHKQFLAYRHIHHQDFLREGQFVTIGNAPPNRLMHLAIRVRVWANEVLRKYVDGDREHAIASALVLGITDGLDHDLLSAYGATGTLHVLAVSGLHISIIYMIIGWLLSPLNKSAAGKWSIAIISIAVLWGYAFVTGLSPSVLRAVTMFTFVALAKPWKQKVNIYNALAASAFLLLLSDPYMIMSVGFQLSYLAVLGIVYLQPRLYAWWEPEHRIWDEIWKVTSVSIAAQIATLPLGLLYFHQFPNYFILSNLLVIPASFVVLIAGLLMLAVSYMAVIAKIFGWIVAWMVKAMNFIVFTIDRIPFSKMDNIVITPIQSLVMAMIIVCLLLLLNQRKFYYGLALMTGIVVFSWSSWIFDFQHSQPRLIVYHVSQHSAVDVMWGSNALSLCDTALVTNTASVDLHLKPGRMQYGIETVDMTTEGNDMRQVASGKLMVWRGKKIFILETDQFPSGHLKVDYLIVSKNAIRNLDQLSWIEAGKIILDSSNSFYLAERLVRQAEGSGRTIYSVHHQGAYDEIISL